MNKANIKMAISELHTAFHMFNKELFNNELPEPAILIQSRGNKKNVLGWCSVYKIWRNNKDNDSRWEINIVAEALSMGVDEVMCILLHEMVHLHNLFKGIKDTSRNGTYHNKNYRDTAEAHGLYIEHDKRIGWSLSKLTEKSKSIIESYKINPNAFNLSRIDFNNIEEEEEEGEGKEKRKRKRKSSVRKWVCPKCDTIIRSTKKVRVICADCQVLFELEDEEEDMDQEDEE